jgi:hypothetical protein
MPAWSVMGGPDAWGRETSSRAVGLNVIAKLAGMFAASKALLTVLVEVSWPRAQMAKVNIEARRETCMAVEVGLDLKRSHCIKQRDELPHSCRWQL